MVLATLTFASADVLTKQLTSRHPVAVVMALRYLVNVLLLTLVLGPRLGRDLWRVNRRGLIILRAVCLAAASLTVGLALQRMPVAETVSILYMFPIFLMLMSMPILGEKVSATGWLSASLGFCGVLLIARPGGNLAPLGVLFAVMNAVLSATYHLLTRFLMRTESTSAMLYTTAVIGCLIFWVLAIPDLSGLSLDLSEVAKMAALGGLATLGHFLFTAAYREAPPALLAPINYVHLFWAGGLGWLFFDHIPDHLSLIGMAMVFAAGAGAASMAWFGRARPSE